MSSSLLWYGRRLLRMGPREVLWRGWQRISDGGDRLLLRGARVHSPSRPSLLGWAKGNEDPGNAFFHPEFLKSSARLLGPLADSEKTDRWRARFSASVRTLGEEAQEILGGRVPLFDGAVVADGAGPDSYHRDPRSGRSWPRVFHGDIDYRSGGAPGDIRLVWELNRLHHLTRMAVAARATQDSTLANSVVEKFEEFLASAPKFVGVAWASPLECGVRILSVTLALAGIRGLSTPTAEFRERVARFIYDHARFVERKMASFSSRNNHTIGEAASLFVAGSLFPEFRRSQRWQEEGFARLAEEAEAQIHPDGVPVEQSPGYGLFVLQFLGLAALIRRRSGSEIPSGYEKRVASLADYLSAVADEAGGVPLLADGDDGVAWDLGGTRGTVASTVRVARAALVGKTEIGAWEQGGIDLPSALLADDFLRSGDSTTDFDLEPSNSPRGSRFFSQGGVAVLRNSSRADSGSETCHLVVRCGPFGLSPLYGHAHADQLSFTLSLGDKPVLVDPGTYLYHGGGVWRDYFRSTRSHNTVCVDGRNQAEIWGPFLWSGPATGESLGFVESEEGVRFRGRLAGYGNLEDPVRHERDLWLGQDGEIVVTDGLQGASSHEVEIGFQLAPELEPLPVGEDGFLLVDDSKPVAFLEFDPSLSRSRVRGELQPISGWISPGFSRLVPAWRVAGRGHFHGSGGWSTRITTDRERIEAKLGAAARGSERIERNQYR